ncbi:MAG: hypothetical protein E4H40_04210, partial [Candidatus Brocadiia bacterium]
FSDCMTLLLTFFVLLLSFASFGEHVLQNLGSSFAEYLPDIGLINIAERESVFDDPLVKYSERLSSGSESRPKDEVSADNFVAETTPLDFTNLKVFTVASDEIFWGNGAVVSKDGKELLDAFVYFVRSVPSRLVISEHGTGDHDDIGMERGWSVLAYMTDNGVDINKISISSMKMTEKAAGSERILEFTLLDKDVYE